MLNTNRARQSGHRIGRAAIVVACGLTLGTAVLVEARPPRHGSYGDNYRGSYGGGYGGGFMQDRYGNRHGNLTPAGRARQHDHCQDDRFDRGRGVEVFAPPCPAPRGPGIDLVLLLDASSSMDGLIDQAKQQLWSVVCDLDCTSRGGERPVLRVAVYMYGNDYLSPRGGYIRQLVPLTTDLDAVSQALFSIRTQGGTEHCGQAIERATFELDWARHPDSYRTIFIAGNEAFTQGPVHFQEAIDAAKHRGVVVNTVHCGDERTGYDDFWNRAAHFGGGTFFNINHQRAVPRVHCPQDDELVHLNGRLNDTYLWYGDDEHRRGYAGNQRRQDANAAGFGPGVLAGRAAAKASDAYRAVGRDLVDSLRDDPGLLDRLPRDQLPEQLRSLDRQQQRDFVRRMGDERSRVQSEIERLSRQRERFLHDSGHDSADTFGDAMRRTVRDQVRAAGFAPRD